MKPDDSPETDAHGFAPTNVVNARVSRRGGRVRFYRVWMKPADLAFPPVERRVTGPEEIAMIANYSKAKDEGRVSEGTLRMATGGRGGIPPREIAERDDRGGVQKFSNSTETDPPKNFETPVENSPPSTLFRWDCPHCAQVGWTRLIRHEGEPAGQLRARATAEAFDQHADVSARCVSNELNVQEDREGELMDGSTRAATNELANATFDGETPDLVPLPFNGDE